MSRFFTVALTIFFAIDSIGTIPTFLSLLKKFERKKRILVAARELFFALIIMILFNYLGRFLLDLLSLTRTTVQISGGVVLFLIAIRLIFSHDEEKVKYWGETPPFIVPIATPLIASPSVLAVIMIFAKEFQSDLTIISATILAWFVSALIIFFAGPIYKIIGEKGLVACERLMGLIVSLIAIQMFVEGIKGIVSV